MARSKSAPSAAAPAAGFPLSPLMSALLLVVLGAALYANALGGPLLLDDQRSVRENTTIQNLADLGQVLHPPAQSPMTGRPVPNLTLAINYAMGGDAVMPYRATNIALHILAGLALFGWLRRTLPRLLTPAGEDAEPAAPSATSDGPALAVSALWLAHPLNTETVDYLTQRTESLMSLFVLTALWASARALGTARRGLWEGVAIAAAFAAVGSKESALVLPLLLVLWDRVFVYATLAEAWAARKRLYLGVLASWLLFAVFARELPFFVERGFEEHVSRLDYFLHQGPVILRYLGLTVWPQNLVFDYGAPEALVLREALPGVLVVALLGVATLVALVRWPRVGFWGAWFFITLAPASSLIPIPTEVAAERRMYLPLIALLVLAAWALRTGLARLAPASRTRAAWGLTAVLVLALGATTVARNRDYQDALRLWETSLDRWPQPRAHEHISMAYRDLGRLDDSLRHLRIAAPQSPNARHALASLLLERGQVREAITEFREYIRARPNDPHILIGREELAVALLQVKDFAGAAEQFRLVAQATPGYARARIGLGEALVGMNRPAEALAAYREATQLQPDNAGALVNLALLQRAAGETAGAIASLRASLKLTPGDVAARQSLIQMLLSAKDFAGAETETRALLTVTPNDAAAYNVLGITLASQGRVAPAREAFEHALAVDPGFAEARQNLARLR